MDELAQARVELTLLEEEERELVEELLDVRAAIAMQRAKIDALSRSSLRPSTINYLPTEILLVILDLDVHTHRPPELRKQTLASVCRRWRDVILQTPYFWSTIHVASATTSINTYLERSRGTLLDIVIECAPSSPSKHLALIPGLDIAMACAHRWRSLLITTGDNSFRANPEEVGQKLLIDFIADRINHLHFPCLKSVTISSLCDVGHLSFLSIARAPALEHLELNKFMTIRDIPDPVAMLKTLKLSFQADSFIDYPPCWSLIRTQALSKLSLSGRTQSFSSQPNSLHFPSLMSLEMIRVADTKSVLDAIVVPNLKQASFSQCDSPSVTLSGSRSKFTNVRQLSFTRCSNWDGLLHSHAIRFCEAFPGVHHVELDAEDWPYLFNPPSTPTEPGPNSHIQYPMDLWTELKGLTFKGLHSKWLEDDQPMAWLLHRRTLSLQQLHLKVNGSYYVKNAHQGAISTYKLLKENCILELDGFSSMDFPMPEDSSSRGVSSFHITTQRIWI